MVGWPIQQTAVRFVMFCLIVGFLVGHPLLGRVNPTNVPPASLSTLITLPTVTIDLEPSCFVMVNSTNESLVTDERVSDTYSGTFTKSKTAEAKLCTPFLTSPEGFWHVPSANMELTSHAEFVEPSCTRNTYTRERMLQMFHRKRLLFYGHSHLRDHNMQFLDFIGYYTSEETSSLRNHFSWERNITTKDGYYFHITFVFAGLFLPVRDDYPTKMYDIAYVAIGAWHLLYADMGYDAVMQSLHVAFQFFNTLFGHLTPHIVVYNLHYMHSHCDPKYRNHQQFRRCLHYKRQETFRKMIQCTALKTLPRDKTYLWDVLSVTRSTYARLDTSIDRHHYVQNSRVMRQILQVWVEGTDRLFSAKQTPDWPTLSDLGFRARVC
eukprot:PhF_6_TR40438/c0_g1_i1/m.60326